MGMETILVGVIAEPWVQRDDGRNHLFRRWNRQILGTLPECDGWPPLSRGLFAWTELGPLRGGYRGSIIHFGGRFNSIEREWDQWLTKFEGLLQRLYWESSVVHLDTELAGSFRFDWWHTNTEAILASPPELTTTWNFEGPFRRWSDIASA
jgi:hypothetical protein